MNLAFFIAKRYTLSKQHSSFISFISIISIIGISLGVAVLIVVLSVMNGFERELQQRILGAIPHASLYIDKSLVGREKVISRLESNDTVVAAAPFINMEGMLTAGGQVQGILTTGIMPQAEKKISIIGNHLVAGNLDALQAGKFGIVIGDIVAVKLGVWLGDKVTLVLPAMNISPAGITPRLKRFTVIGVFSLGAQLDARLSFIHIRDAAAVSSLPLDHIQGINLKVSDVFQAPAIVKEIALNTPLVTHTSNWTYSQGNLFQSIRMERRMVALLLFLIIAVASFNIVSNLIMLVAEKKSDIAILRTLGATPRFIMSIFIFHGATVGILGTLIGTTLGIAITLALTYIISAIEYIFSMQFLSIQTYFINYFPTDLRGENILFIMGISLAISFLVTIYPAYKAMRINPAQVLKHE